MSRYAFDEEHRRLIVMWGTGRGNVAVALAGVSAAIVAEKVLFLTEALSDLSDELWRTYTHPAAAADSMEINSEGWRRQGDREAFARRWRSPTSLTKMPR